MHEEDTVDPSVDEMSGWAQSLTVMMEAYCVPFGTKSGAPPGVGDGHWVSRMAHLLTVSKWLEVIGLSVPDVERS